MKLLLQAFYLDPNTNKTYRVMLGLKHKLKFYSGIGVNLMSVCWQQTPTLDFNTSSGIPQM